MPLGRLPNCGLWVFFKHFRMVPGRPGHPRGDLQRMAANSDGTTGVLELMGSTGAPELVTHIDHAWYACRYLPPHGEPGSQGNKPGCEPKMKEAVLRLQAGEGVGLASASASRLSSVSCEFGWAPAWWTVSEACPLWIPGKCRRPRGSFPLLAQPGVIKQSPQSR